MRGSHTYCLTGSGERTQLNETLPVKAAPSLQIEQLAQTARLRAADGNLGLLFVVHAQLVAGLKPRHNLADVVDVDHEAAMVPVRYRRP